MLKLASFSRLKAATVHLIASAVIATAALIAMLIFWYPPPYFLAMGGLKLMLLIVGIDVALGPLLTLIVFDTRKKSLPFDLAFIAALQLGALGYGIHAMQAGRPVFTVFTGEALFIVSASEIDPEELAKARNEEFRHLSLSGPILVAAEPPNNPEEASGLAFAALAGMGIEHLPRYYVPFAEHRSRLLQAARTLDELEQAVDKDILAKAHDHLQRMAPPAETLLYLPVKTRREVLLGIVDAVSGELRDIL
jgi:hypothetical protein